MRQKLKYTQTLSLFTIFCFFSFQSVGQNHQNDVVVHSDSIDVVKMLNGFVDAFSNLNWKRFSDCFADDATAFFPPSAKFPSRANNKEEIETIFKKVFDNARKQKSAPPYIIIEPKDIKIQIIDKIAIVTFVLNDPDLFGRRTIVLTKENDTWLIIHLHASGVVTAK